MNNENLRPFNTLTENEQREIRTKGGQASAQSRRRKADIRKAVQAILDGTYTDDKGEGLSGCELIALKLFEIATDTQNKQCLSAIKLLCELSGQNKTPDDKKLFKAELDYLKARIETEIAKLENIRDQNKTDNSGIAGDIFINITPLPNNAVDLIEQ